MAQVVNGWRPPVQVQNIDEEMVLQLIEYSLNMGQCLQVLKDQKKILRQENTTLKEQIIKLPSALQCELHSVHEDVMAKMHTISVKINELIRTYKMFANVTGQMRRSGVTGALCATEQAITYLEDCKAFVDCAMKGGVEKNSKKALEELFKLEVVATEAIMQELAVVPENNALAHVIAARFQQVAQKINNLEKKVDLIRAENLILQRQIEALKSESHCIGRACRTIVEVYSLDPCLNHLHLFQDRLSMFIQEATDKIPTITRLRDKKEFEGYIERFNVIQSDVSALGAEIEAVAESMKM